MPSITVGGLTFRWADQVLLITTPTGQHLLNGHATTNLLVFLQAQQDDIFATEQANELPPWAQATRSGSYVIGSANSVPQQERPLPMARKGRPGQQRSYRKG